MMIGRRNKFVILVILIFLVMGCSQPMEVFFTPTPLPTQTATPTLTPTITATATLTPTLVPTATFTPTLTPTPTAAVKGDPASLIIKLSEMPDGFKEISPKDSKLFTAEFKKALGIESFFQYRYLKFDNLQAVYGFTTSLPYQRSMTGDSEKINKLVTGLADSFSKSLESKDMEADIQPLKIPAKVGAAGAGKRIISQSTKPELKSYVLITDLIFFQRNQITAFVCVEYLEGYEPLITIEEAIRIMDERIEKTPLDIPAPSQPESVS